MNSATPACVIGLDVGGTKIAAGLIVLPEGRVLARRVVPTGAGRGGGAVLEDVVRLAGELAKEAGVSRREVEAIGLCVCELVDREGRLASANFIEWLDQPVQERLAALAPTTLEADVRAAALAEARFGAGRPYENFLYVTVGTGISCSLVLEGRPYLGARGATGTMGSSSISVTCQGCGEIHRRTLEEIASGPALVSRFQALGGAVSSGQEVLAAAANGNTQAQRIVDSAGEALGSQVALMVNVLDPEAVVIGGGLGLSEGCFRQQLIVSTRRHSWWPPHRELQILSAATGVEAGWMGAALRGWETVITPR